MSDDPRLAHGTLKFQGIHADILALCDKLETEKHDWTPEIDVEGSLNCGKTTMSIWRQLEKAKRYPGIWMFAYRYSETDNKTKLRPAIELIAGIRGDKIKWDGGEMFYNFENGSRLYSFGLKAVDLLSRYDKLRGLGVSDIANDQAESTPRDIHEEVRARLRPDLRMTLMQKEYPRLLFLTPNPAGHRHFLTTDYPEDNHIEGRFYFRISIYDNVHNIGPQAVRSLESSYPSTHVKHGPLVLGKRGMTVIGDAIFEDSFQRSVHIKEVTPDLDDGYYEAFDIGKHCPSWTIAQRGYGGGWTYLAGIIGQDMFLEDFLPIVKKYRKDWFGDLEKHQVKTCYAKGGGSAVGDETRYTDINLLRDAGFHMTTRQNGSAPDVMLAMIERLAGYMRRRDARGRECIAINATETHWLRVSHEGTEMCPFLAQSFEAGAVWDEHFVSVAHRDVRRMKEDDWFEHAVRLAAALELNFGADQLSRSAQEQRLRDQRKRDEQTNGGRWESPQSWLGHMIFLVVSLGLGCCV